MVEVDGRTDARLGELSGGGARAYDFVFVTPGPTVDGGRSMVDGRERLYRLRWAHGVPRATAPSRAPYVAFGDLRDKERLRAVADRGCFQRRAQAIFEITLSKPEDLERAMSPLKHSYEDS
jgi:hypothetical protein